jgi:hypothetical protein
MTKKTITHTSLSIRKKLFTFIAVLFLATLFFTSIPFVKGVDTTAPISSSLSAIPAKAGSYCNFTSIWTDETGLASDGGYIFETNNTGVWTNDTWTSFITNPNTVSVFKTLNTTAGTIVGYRWLANDTSNNWGDSGIQTLTTTYYHVISMTTLVGTVVNGTISDLNDGDSDVMRIDESDPDTNAIDLRFNFTNMPTIPYAIQINLLQRYVGLASHHIDIYAWNYSSSAWVIYGTAYNAPSYNWVNMTLTGNLTDLVRNGNFTIRMLHAQHGESTHRFYIDTLVINVEGDYGPAYNNVGRTLNYAGLSTEFHAYVSDQDPDLSHWILSTNNTGVWVNSTATAFATGAGGWANATVTLNSTVGNIVQYYFWANCTDGNAGQTSTRQITLQAGTPPVFSNIGTTTNVTGTSCTFYAYITEDNALLDYWIFSSTLTGPWTNSSNNYVNSMAEWANITYLLPTTDAYNISYRFYATTIYGDTATSDINYVITQASPSVANQIIGGNFLLLIVILIFIVIPVFMLTRRNHK